MPKYRFQARDADGKPVFGKLEARSIDEAVAELAADGMDVDRGDVEEIVTPATEGRRMKEAEAAEVAARVAELARAGLPLAPGLRALADELDGKRVSRLLRQVAERLEAGSSLEDALGVDSHRFPAHLRGLVLAGVATGRLPDMLEQYVAFQRDRSQLRRRIWSSMAYPMLLLTMLLLLFLGFATLLVPQFEQIFLDFDANLPLLTQMLFSLSRPGPTVLVCLPAFALYALLLLATTRVPVWGRRIFYAVPLVGPLWRFNGMVSLTRLLGLFVDQEVPLPEALRYTAQGLGEPDLAAACRGAAHDIGCGRSLDEALARYWQFLPTLRSFAHWGHEGACLADSLRAASQVFQQRLGVQMRLFDSVVPSILFLVVVVCVGFLVTALMMPLINLISTLAF